MEQGTLKERWPLYGTQRDRIEMLGKFGHMSGNFGQVHIVCN